MSAPSIDVIRKGRERVRTGPWRGDREVAYLSPAPDAPLPSAAFVRHCMETLATRGFSRVVTAALSPLEQVGFLAAGFETAEQLHLLSVDLRRARLELPGHGGGPRPQRVRRSEISDVLAVDNAAFSPFWHLDELGLNEAMNATPKSRLRGAVSSDAVWSHRRGPVQGYTVCGRAGSRGFVQRLAVAPTSQGQGLGRLLLVDCLSWMKRHGVSRAMVNTQHGNERALGLYVSVGFGYEPSGLCVLSAGIS